MLRRAVTRYLVRSLGALTVLAGVGLAQGASAAEVIKIGTLAPKASPWGQVFTVWEKAVSEKSGGRLELQIFYNGTQGDEGAMIGKAKAGQIDGAAVTCVGLGKIYKPIAALQLPGLFTSWQKLDRARDALRSEFENGLTEGGFTLIGWGDVGMVRLLSKGLPVRSPDDVKGQKPFMWRDDLIQPVLFQIIGGVTPVPLNVPEVLPTLNTGAINIVSTPSLSAEQLQWASKLDHIAADTSGVAIGGLVLSRKRMDALSADLRQIVLDTGKVAASALTTRIRGEDAAAFNRLKGKMTVITLSAAEQAKWDALYKQVRQRLSQGTFSPDLITKLEGFAK